MSINRLPQNPVRMHKLRSRSCKTPVFPDQYRLSKETTNHDSYAQKSEILAHQQLVALSRRPYCKSKSTKFCLSLCGFLLKDIFDLVTYSYACFYVKSMKRKAPF